MPDQGWAGFEKPIYKISFMCHQDRMAKEFTSLIY